MAVCFYYWNFLISITHNIDCQYFQHRYLRGFFILLFKSFTKTQNLMKYQLSKFLWGIMLFSVAILLQVSCIPENSEGINPIDPSASLEKSTQEVPDNPLENLRMDPTTNKMLANLRAATAKYHDLATAEAAGYSLPPGAGCVSVPGLGGMGFHYVNMPTELNNPFAVYDPTMPQALLYEEMKNGQMKLVGVEFVLDKAIWDEENDEPPYFGSQEFDIDNAEVLDFPNYQLHVWIWRHNPNGIFTMFNPNVTCL